MHRLSLLGPNGQALSVVTSGSGPALMLVHGFPLDHRMWDEQLAQLSKRFRVICPELRGFGASTLAEGASYRIGDLAEDLEFVGHSLAHDEPIALCGLSMGGYVAFEYWARHPERLSQLVLTSTRPGLDADAAKAGRRMMAEKALSAGTPAAVEGLDEKLLAAKSADHIRQKTLEMMRSVAPEAIVAAQTAMVHRAGFEERLSEIQVPTLVLTGEQDQLAPPGPSKEWAAMIPKARFQSLPDCGHLSPIEQPELFNQALVQFLDGSR
ncbi:MAG: alpha/beta fold hydrolase [Pirellulaceae bacterium]